MAASGSSATIEPVGLIVAIDQASALLTTSGRLVAVDLFERTARLLERARSSGMQVAVVAPDSKVVRSPGLGPELQGMRIVRATMDFDRTARTAVRAVGAQPAQGRGKGVTSDRPLALAVAADRRLRAAFVRAGALAVAHPAEASLALEGGRLLLVELSAPRDTLAALALVPYRVARDGDGWSCLGTTTAAGLHDALERGVKLTVVALDPSIEDAFVVRLDGAAPTGRPVSSDGSSAIYALGASDDVADIASHGAHGHFVALAPEPDALVTPLDNGWRLARQLVADWPSKVALSAVRDLRPKILTCSTTASEVSTDLDRYSGSTSLDAAGPVASRHVAHPDNARVVQALLQDLRAIGYCPWTQSFTTGGRTLQNVFADLPGTGWFIWPKLWVELRRLLIEWPPPPDPPPWDQLLRLLGAEDVDADFVQGFDGVPPTQLRRALLDRLGLLPWIPWRLLACPLAGPGAELVLIGSHLDSTAARDIGYQPASGAAPGRDDDATGMATVLAAARELWAQRGRLHHTIRFCFFNAEESGLVGSQAYAASLKATGAPVRAVICSDMTGYNSDQNLVFEVHAGATDPAVRDASVPIAESIATWAAILGQVGPAQVYRGTNAGSGADRSVYDGAIGRSDHASFQSHGYPAVVVSEDFFINLASEPTADSNPNYHRASDTAADAGYAAGIACAVIRAAEELAT